MKRRLFAMTAVLGLTFAGGALVAQAAGGDPCDAVFTASTVAKLKAYDACRFNRIDAKLASLSTPTSTPKPTPTATPTKSAPAPTPTSTPKPSGSASPSPTPTPTPTVPASATCAKGREVVKFTGAGSAGLGQYGQGNYDASAEQWNVGGYNYSQVMGVCTHDAWYADVTTDNAKGDGAVKAYPSMRRIYHDWGKGGDFSGDPLISSFPRLAVDFAATDPASCAGCIYDTAFDIWMNGIANNSSTELMIWTHNVGQTPYGSKVASGIKLAGHTWDLYSGNSDHYLAYVPTDTSNIAAATFDVKDFASHLTSVGRLPSKSRMGQISYGVETVSTNGVARHWDFTKFTVSDS